MANEALEQTYPFELPALSYDYDALEAAIDAETMKLHHDKHHQAYVDKLNEAVGKNSDLQQKTLAEILKDLDAVPEDIRAQVRNNGGGHANHSMFWTIMSADGGEPEGELATAIDEAFGSFDDFKTKFNDAGVKQFGSGWVFVTVGSGGKLEIASAPNQDTPLHKSVEPLFGNDVWEHAYYLKYQNKRPDYLKAWWEVADWSAIGERYTKLKG